MLGEALRLMRIFHDVKTVELAAALKISQSHVSEIENGKKQPSLDVIEKYATYFETTPSMLMFFAEDLKKNGALKDRTKSGIRSGLIKFLQIVEKFDNDMSK